MAAFVQHCEPCWSVGLKGTISSLCSHAVPLVFTTCALEVWLSDADALTSTVLVAGSWHLQAQHLP